jgi:hypothetical protein
VTAPCCLDCIASAALITAAALRQQTVLQLCDKIYDENSYIAWNSDLLQIYDLDTVVPAMNELRIGMIGCGGIAEVHVERLKALEDAQLVGFADIVEEKAR